MDRRESGQAIPLLLIVVTLAALTLVGVGKLGSRMIARQRAQAAADATALAGVTLGDAGARQVAASNSATVVSLAIDEAADGVTCSVVVIVDGVTAQAQATDRPTTAGARPAWPSGGAYTGDVHRVATTTRFS
ncbi:MAG TPA: hypothetical protein PKV27_05980 [Ilumatobacteraceae bacterium]|nr:hypothetical protein [Ilumatobacteraceae bacterium]